MLLLRRRALTLCSLQNLASIGWSAFLSSVNEENKRKEAEAEAEKMEDEEGDKNGGMAVECMT